jgi:hypothetical protein
VKRLLRILRGSAILLSLLLLLLTLFLWPRSHHVGDGISYGRNGYAADGSLIRRVVGVSSSQGQVLFNRGHFSSLWFNTISPREEGLHYERSLPTDLRVFADWSYGGFSHVSVDDGSTFGMKAVAVPHWLVALLSSLPPALWLIRHILRRKRSSPNACPTCGYDLRATPDRCPECGTLTSTSTPAAPTSSARDTG